jgi:hypothetical protein
VCIAGDLFIDALLYAFLCCSVYLFCVVLCIVCVYMCTELLPLGGYPIAVKYIIYHTEQQCMLLEFWKQTKLTASHDCEMCRVVMKRRAGDSVMDNRYQGFVDK